MPTQRIAHPDNAVADRKPPMTHSKHAHHPAVDTPQQYHGDLRKGAYLRRRAAYQMQTTGTAPMQAGTLPARDKESA
jgi:hypothetical protein